MAIYTMLGMIAVVAVVGFGVYWLATNLTFKSQPELYIYKKDESGNDYVQDNSESKKVDPDA